MTTRRSFLISTSTLGLVSAFGGAAFSQGRFEVVHTPAEWRQILSEDAYFVMREEQTEPPGYSPLDQEKRAGVFSCAGCDLPVFGSDKKFDSGTGWPSFFDPYDRKNVWFRRDCFWLYLPYIQQHRWVCCKDYPDCWRLRSCWQWQRYRCCCKNPTPQQRVPDTKQVKCRRFCGHNRCSL